MAVIYSVSMNKGGVGKTTLATNLASVISIEQPNAKVLLIDMDGQGNCALGFGLKPQEFDLTMYDVLVEDKEILDVCIPLENNLYLAPSNNDMNFIEMDILTDLKKYTDPFSLLRKKIDNIRNSFDYIIIDTPPSLGLVSGNVLSIKGNNILIPFSPESFSVEGLIRVIEAVKDFRDKKNPSLEIAGIIGMMVNAQTLLHPELMKQARQYCLKKDIPFLDAAVPRSIRFANSTAYDKKPAVFTDKNAIVRSYFEMWKELKENGTQR